MRPPREATLEAKMFTLTRAAILSCLFCGLLGAAAPRETPGSAGTPATDTATTALPRSVPRMMRFSGALRDAAGQPLSGTQGVTFALYSEQTGGVPEWLETQTVEDDSQGNYSVLLGSMREDGLPQDLFTANEARWLGITVTLPGAVEQPRVLLVSVAYALKASDAETLGGKPLSAFVLAPTADSVTKDRTAAIANNLPLATLTTAGNIPKFDVDGTTLTNSVIAENSGSIGIGTTNPGAALDIELNNSSFILGGTGTHAVSVQGALSNGRFGQDSEGFFFTSDTPGKALKFLTNGGTLAERMRIASNGNVGIGNSLPSAILHITKDDGSVILDGAGSHAYAVRGTGGFQATSGRFGQDYEGIFMTSDADGKVLKFFTTSGANLNERMRVTSSGDVGIGTTGPAFRLDVQGGQINASGGLCIVGDCRSAWPTSSGTVNALARFSGATTLANSQIVDNGTNVGVGIQTPTQKLHINGGVRLDTTAIKPACDATVRGTFWVTQGGAGVKDSVEVCAKDAADAYDWRMLY